MKITFDIPDCVDTVMISCRKNVNGRILTEPNSFTSEFLKNSKCEYIPVAINMPAIIKSYKKKNKKEADT